MNPTAWTILEEHAPAVHALLLRLVLRRDVAEELLHDLFVKTATRTNIENPGAYLRRAAINLAMDWRRKRRGWLGSSALAEVLDDARGVTQQAQDADDVERILDAANNLPELARQAFVLRFVQGESYDVIGATLGRSAQQARGLCHSGVRAIRRKLGIRQVAHERAE